MLIEIKSASLGRVREYKGQNFGEQTAGLLGGDFPLRFVINVRADRALQPGIYRVSPSAFMTDQFGNLALRRLRPDDLTPEPVAASKPAPARVA